jgi:hypothetical protein
MIRDYRKGSLEGPMAGIGGAERGIQSPSAPRPETAIESAFRSLEEQNKRLAVTVARLNDRLTPVLSSLDPLPNKVEAGERPTSPVPLAESIFSQVEVMAQQASLLEEIIERLAV